MTSAHIRACCRATGLLPEASRPVRGRSARFRATGHSRSPSRPERRMRSRAPPARRRRSPASNLSTLIAPMTPVADDHRRTDPSPNAPTAVRLTRKVRILRDVGEDLLSLRPHDLDAEVGLVVQVEAHSDKPPQIVQAARAHDHQAVSLNHLDGAAVVGNDSLQLVEDRLERLFEAQRLARAPASRRRASRRARARAGAR